jgi:17beta-estradiol 17-dehydrogenase / very-long-chain 3-oxoacyl-CoA reductase
MLLDVVLSSPLLCHISHHLISSSMQGLNFVKSQLNLLSKANPFQLLVLFVIAVLVIRYVVPIFSGFYRFFLRSGKNLKRLGEWAVVTGATDGIGLAYAEQLAQKGLNVLLVSRTPAKLSKTQADLSAKFPSVQFRTLVIDFSRFDEVSQFQFKKAVENLNIGVLINNVGQSYDHPDYFHSLESATVQSLIDLNIKSTTIVSHIVLPLMLAQKRGAIVNISSFAGLIVSPLLTQYSACKAYVDKFSQGLNAEYRSKGVTVQVQNPLFVSTKLAKIKYSSLTVPSPAGYATAGIRQIGYGDQISPYWVHALQIFVVKMLPESLVSAYAFKLHLGLRKRALKKKEQQTKAQ